MVKPSVVMTGASGLVGTWLRRTAPADIDVVSVVHQTGVTDTASVEADLRDADDVIAAFETVGPALVIHAAMAVNEQSIVGATDNVARAASRVCATVVYISTDAVFSGDGRPVDENTPPDPIWDYGPWKTEAEQRILHQKAGWAVVRLPLVVSLDPPDRNVQRIRQGSRNQPTEWFTDETRQPAMAADVAAAIWRITLLPAEHRSGIWHLPGPERLSRFEIARRVVEASGLDVHSISRALAPADAQRPRHLHLLDQRAREVVHWNPARILVRRTSPRATSVFSACPRVHSGNMTPWRGHPADVGVLTAPSRRGESFAGRLVSTMVATALPSIGVAWYRALAANTASLAVAHRLGFIEYGQNYRARRAAP